MSVVDTIPTTTVTVPAALAGANNGQLPSDWLRSFDGTTRTDYKMFAPVSYAMQAMHLAAAEDDIELRTTGRYRSYARQVALFRDRYQLEPIPGRPTKIWNGQVWYQKPGVAMAATPGTSNHGLGLADDIAVELDGDPDVESVEAETLVWLRDNAADFGFGLETRREAWHWHWIGGNRLTQRTVDILARYGIPLPDLAGWLFTAPAPTPPEEDDMPLTDDEIDRIAQRTARYVGGAEGFRLNDSKNLTGVIDAIKTDLDGTKSRVKKLFEHFGLKL